MSSSDDDEASNSMLDDRHVDFLAFFVRAVKKLKESKRGDGTRLVDDDESWNETNSSIRLLYPHGTHTTFGLPDDADELFVTLNLVRIAHDMGREEGAAAAAVGSDAGGAGKKRKRDTGLEERMLEVPSAKELQIEIVTRRLRAQQQGVSLVRLHIHGQLHEGVIAWLSALGYRVIGFCECGEQEGKCKCGKLSIEYTEISASAAKIKPATGAASASKQTVHFVEDAVAASSLFASLVRGHRPGGSDDGSGVDDGDECVDDDDE